MLPVLSYVYFFNDSGIVYQNSLTFVTKELTEFCKKNKKASIALLIGSDTGSRFCIRLRFDVYQAVNFIAGSVHDLMKVIYKISNR